MYSDRKKRTWIWVLLAAVLIAAAVLLIYAQSGPKRAEIREKGEVAIRELVETAARQCYAVEGVYPPNLAYLEDHYGIEINHKDFYVTYEAFAPNVIPSIYVTERGATLP